MFVAGRTSQFTDVLIDTFGAILGVAMINVAIRIIGKIRQPKSTKNFQKTIAQKKTKCYNQKVNKKTKERKKIK